MRSLQLLAHAKINLTLEVLSRRSDGFHEIRSLMVPLALADRITLAEGGRKLALSVSGAPDLETDDNLVLQAARAFRSTFGLRAGLSITLEKRIPIAAGLGGGSSDAAAVLRGLARLSAIAEPLLQPLAEALGSDVPFFLKERPALASGRGERLLPLSTLPPIHLLLVKPDFGISAAAAYHAWKGHTLTHSEPDVTSPAVYFSRWKSIRTARQVGKLLVNHLQAGCLELQPELRSLLERLESCGATGVLMSGSGSTCFAVFSSAGALQQGRRRFQAHAGEKLFSTRTLPGSTLAGRGRWIA